MEERKKRAAAIVAELKKLFPDAKIVLKYSNDWELLVSVVLSAQCTDTMVNKVTDKLFKKYKNLDDYVNADLKEFEQDIKSTGFYHNKAKSIQSCCQALLESYDGKLPQDIEKLVDDMFWEPRYLPFKKV